MDKLELDRENAELLPDRQALSTWNFSCHFADGRHFHQFHQFLRFKGHHVVSFHVFRHVCFR
jgi:hypothetical protein